MPSPEACADETDRELRAEIDRLRTALRAIANAPDHHRGDWYEMVEWMCGHARGAVDPDYRREG